MKKNSESSREPDDTYSRVDYRRFVAWPARIQRERPLLEFFLESLPEKTVLDLGCGTGEHGRFFSSLGYHTLGIDQSASMVAKAREHTENPLYNVVVGDLRDLAALVERPTGGAISLGNTLPHLKDSALLGQLFEGLTRALLPSGVFLFQILNYEWIIGQDVRYLPLNFRDQKDHEAVFLRLMKPLPDDRILFCPSTLHFDPSRENPIEVIRSKTVELMGWQRKHLLPLLETFGFEVLEIWGGMEFDPFSADSSSDLVMLVRRST